MSKFFNKIFNKFGIFHFFKIFINKNISNISNRKLARLDILLIYFFSLGFSACNKGT